MDVINGSDDEGGCNRRSKIRTTTKNNVNIFNGQGCCTEIKEQNPNGDCSKRNHQVCECFENEKIKSVNRAWLPFFGNI